MCWLFDIDGWDGSSRLKIRKRRHVYGWPDWIIVVKNGAVAELISRTHLGSTRASELFRDSILRNHYTTTTTWKQHFLIEGRQVEEANQQQLMKMTTTSLSMSLSFGYRQSIMGEGEWETIKIPATWWSSGAQLFDKGHCIAPAPDAFHILIPPSICSAILGLFFIIRRIVVLMKTDVKTRNSINQLNE